MKVLLLGATGNLGIRLVPALLSHNHNVVAYVRSSSKLQSLLPPDVFSQITIVEGDAKSQETVEKAILDHRCTAIINTAGLAAVVPWGHSDLPIILQAAAKAAKVAGEKSGKPLRGWFLGGVGALDLPGTPYLLMDYMKLFPEHRVNFDFLQTIPTNSLQWSMLCPGQMNPKSTDFSVPTKTTPGNVVGGASTPPGWKDGWVKHIPFFGSFLWVASHIMTYKTILEDNAEFIAADLEKEDSEWIGKKVGTIEVPR